MGLPVYMQIHDDLKAQIENGTWPVGTRLPSERKLAEHYQVSRMTLRQAVGSLIEEGLLKRKAGSGTFVTNQKIQEHMSGISSFTETMRSQGKQPRSETLSYRIVEPTFKEAEQLALTPTERVLRMERLRYGDEEPICLETTTVAAHWVRDMSQAEVTESLYQAISARWGLVPVNAQQYISAILAQPQTAELLQIQPGAPILKLKQLSYFENQQPFEFVETQYAAERFEFYLKQ
ncbi:GntR family transcriptional regulator [Fructilactobacillus myrtifloralis]|uniref:GntR family transcriptional regulator n=1 Tax=Fructilactobacillus myrtifloralis TaxID=2940301 RepID=A0ABY5BQM9_9LACO|nr:GntR family transcriptional regulator [Fructilactobacillus myrtifloralis]USS84896.1 GntR family transcriptional regulator [Fructilactobacillus myrtifloralis]